MSEQIVPNRDFTFIPDSKISILYNARGFFYDLIVPWQLNPIPCRNVLEIYDRRLCEDDLANLAPDAHIVMMNPGSSKPLSTQSVRVLLSDLQDKLVDPVLVHAKPDKTQFQVMRLMNITGWKYVRILNLSDIREPRSKRFYELYQGLESMHGHYAHSIFSKDRQVERDYLFPKESFSPLIVAWGVGDKIKPLADRYVQSIIERRTVFGWHKIGSLYYHPLPQQHTKVIEWFQKLATALT